MLHVNVPLIDAVLQISNYSKFLKEMLNKKRKLPEHETIAFYEECSMIIQRMIPPKLKDPGANINLIAFPLYRKLGLRDPKTVFIIVQLADRSLKHPYGIVENTLIKAVEFIFLADFINLDIEEAYQMPIILERPFLYTG
ncbi:uncharacterized protein LOC111400376 [Olea europaea var. sylvestris]|uniref:uncharacterized protein LOC111400376 n=1 Tax=Olea europaea var. sylvestris TaxID=158386 RepID=UPI000C1D8ADE|nr:uncharacterized protein LOC111400376 [Olea europaea var. sylvestris]